MTVLVDMNSEQVGTLSAVTEMLVDVDRTINQLLAVKDGLLVLGSRLAEDIGADAVADAEDCSAASGSHAADTMDLAARTVASELAAALHVSDRTVQRRMNEADEKVSMFPAVWRAQGAGHINAAHARVIIEAGSHLEESSARDAYSAQVIEFASTTSAPSRLGRMARRVAERFQHRSIDDRHRSARERRRVWVKAREDGMAELGILGPAALVQGAFDRLTALGIAICDDTSTRAETGDDRNLDEIRCDVALDLVLAGAPVGHDPEGILGGIVGQVSITVPLTTLMGVDDTPAELDGGGPIDAATARRLAATASGWDRIITHPTTGAVLAVDRYRPSVDLKRWLLARDQRCRFPGCGYSARECDLDHTEDAARGGPTEAGNLGALCRRHHVIKHQTPWSVEQLQGGVFAWTSPTGRTYIDRPPAQNTILDPAVARREDEPLPF